MEDKNQVNLIKQTMIANVASNILGGLLSNPNNSISSELITLSIDTAKELIDKSYEGI